MSNKTRNVAKAKTGSALKDYLSWAIWVGIILICALSLAFLILQSLKQDKISPGNCESPVSRQEIFSCNITELEYAVDPIQRELGLSGRHALARESGMVFVFDRVSRQCTWMKEMKFSLDIVWLDENKKIIKLLRDVRPDTYPTSFCAPDTRYVLEVNTGTMDRLGIGVGDSIRL